MRSFIEIKFSAPITPPPIPQIAILDLGGTLQYWQSLDFKYFETATFTLLNLKKIDIPDKYANVDSVAGDATNLSEYEDKQFDLVFSNSVIEHVGDFEDQKRMALEMIRTGKHYYLQVPNKWFILDPHWRVPFVHLLPRKVRAFLVKRLKVGGMPRATTKAESLEIADSVRLMTMKELRQLFPNAKIFREKFLFMTKSFYLFSD